MNKSTAIVEKFRPLLGPAFARPLGPFKIKVNHQLAMTVCHHFDVTTRYAIDVTLGQFLGNISNFKNKTLGAVVICIYTKIHYCMPMIMFLI